VVVLSLSNLLYPTTTANTAPNPIEIISITESSSTSVEILFNSNLPKKSLAYYVINAAIELPVAAPQNSKTQNVVAIAPKSIKKVIKTKATGLITAQIKNLNPKAAYNFSISAKTNKGKMINSAAVGYSPLSNLMDVLSNLPADWGNPTQTVTPIAAPAFTLSSFSESKVVNTAISGYSISSSGGAISSYSISPAAPAGLTFNTSTGLLTGTPTVVAVETTYTITATNATGSAAKTFALTVAPTAPAFTLSSATETRTVNTAATGFTINSTGGAIASFAINATPPGMSFNTTTGALTGTPNTVAAATNYTITATNASGNATRTFTLTVTAVVYTVGQTGPGGGKVFYVATTAFSCGPTLAATCTYLEAAPSGWNTGADPLLTWATSVNNNQTTRVPGAGALQTAIGTGYQNSDAIAAQTGNVAASSAAVVARAYRGNSLSDWYLPSINELTELYNQRTLIAGLQAAGYWSSTEGEANQGIRIEFQMPFTGGHLKDDPKLLRPIRAFS
jgi:hypothetical protein